MVFDPDFDFSEQRLPLSERRGYTNVFNAMYRICREEGIATLWRVSYPADHGF